MPAIPEYHPNPLANGRARCIRRKTCHRHRYSASSLVPLAGDSGKGSEDPQTRLHAAAKGSGHLRMTGEAPAVRHRKLENPESRTCRPHLHFEVPAIGHLAHPKACQRAGANCPEGAHIGVAHPIGETDRGPDDAAGNRLVGSHVPLPAYSTGPRADHKVEFAVEDRLYQAWDRLRPVAAVAIEKHQDFRPALDRRGCTPGAGPAVAAFLLDEDSGPRGAGHCNGTVAAAAVDDDDLVNPLPRH